MKQKVVLEIPGRESQSFEYLAIDFNGTLTFNGLLIEGVRERLLALSEKIAITVLTADTFGTVYNMLSAFPLEIHKIETGYDKKNYVATKSKSGVIAVGNGLNDLEMFSASQFSIAVMGPEGMYAKLRHGPNTQF